MRTLLARTCALLGGFVVAAGAGAKVSDQVAMLFRPFLAEQVTLSPDGRHVAYTEHVRDELNVVIMKLEAPYSKVTLAVADDVGLAFSREKKRASLRFLRWAAPNRLVFAPTPEIIPVRGPSGPKYLAPIMAVDADGRNPRTLIDGPDYIVDILVSVPGGADLIIQRSRASQVVGFMAGDRNHLLVQALGYQFGRQTIVPTTAFQVNVHTGAKKQLNDEFFIGSVGYDQQGKARLDYLRPSHTPERSFGLTGASARKFDEAWLGSLAGRFTISPENYFGERAFPLGFDVDPDVLYIASNVGRDTFGIYALNLKTKQRTDLALEHPHVDLAPLEPSYPAPQLVFDELRGQFAGVRSPGPQPVSLWRDPELAAAQRVLEKKFPQRTVELLDWSEARTAFLLRVTGGTEPGRTFVYQKPENLVLEILRRAPWLPAADLHATEFFEFDPAPGVHLTGYVTAPRTSRLNPPPAVICFADGFPSRAHAEFDREAQVLAAMGFVVIRLNHRGVGGLGRAHRNAILAGIDRVPIDDARTALDWIAARRPIDRRRIVTMGSGFGGYLAVRALQLHPGAFRCAVSFNAPLDPGAWLRPAPSVESGTQINFAQEVNRAFLERGAGDLAALSVLKRPEAITSPVFLLLDPLRDNAITIANTRLRGQLKRLQREVDYVEVSPDFAAELPAARARAYARLEEFFNLNLYDYKVKVGETREIK